MKKFCFLLIISLLLICACNISNEEKRNSNKGEKTMKEGFASKEELLEYIQMNDAADISVEDFEIIDIEQYIIKWRITKDNMENDIAEMVGDGYHLKELERWEKVRYMAREKVSVNTTEEEYHEFIDKFSNAINEAITIPADPLEFSSFVVDNGDKKTTFYILQTKNIEEYQLVDLPNSYPRLLEIGIDRFGPEGATSIHPFCYSKNKKYILIVERVHNEQQLEYIKKFQEIDD